MLNSITSLKIYFKAFLNVFFSKKKFDDVEICLYDRFLCQTEILLLSIQKFFKIPGLFRFFYWLLFKIPEFLMIFVQNARFFQSFSNFRFFKDSRSFGSPVGLILLSIESTTAGLPTVQSKLINF